MQEHKKAELKVVEAELQQWEQVRGVGGHQGGLAAGCPLHFCLLFSVALALCPAPPSLLPTTTFAPHPALQDEKATKQRRRAEVAQLRADREVQLEEQANRRQVAVELRRRGDAEASVRVALDVKRQMEVGGWGLSGVVWVGGGAG